jgi:hypothetical protein
MAVSERKNTNIAEELLARVREAAEAEERSPEELIADALERYLRAKRFDRLASYGESRAHELGIREEDVPRLVKETRKERGR